MSGKPKQNDARVEEDTRTEKDMSVRKEATAPDDARADKIFEGKITVLTASIAGVISLLFTFVTQWVIQNSENARRCDKLEAVVRQKDTQLSEKDARLTEKDTRLAEKNERIADQRAEISLLKQTVLSKDIQLDVKQSTITSYQLKAAEPGGRMVTRKDDELLKTAHGSINDRLGIDDKRPILDQVKESWNKPLAFGSRPGIFIPAPQGLPDDYIAMHNSYYAGDYSNAVDIATKTYRKISPMIELFSGAQIDLRFALVVSETYQIMAEAAFYQGQYKRAAHLMGQAAGLVGKAPPPRLLALESAMAYRAGLSQGFFTRHMSDATKANPDEVYRNEILNELAKLGYLQRFLPNKACTDIGEPIDWEKLCKRKLDLRKLENRNGDIWSTRWKGFGEYEEFNMSQEFRNDLKALATK